MKIGEIKRVSKELEKKRKMIQTVKGILEDNWNIESWFKPVSVVKLHYFI